MIPECHFCGAEYNLHRIGFDYICTLCWEIIATIVEAESTLQYNEEPTTAKADSRDSAEAPAIQ